LNTLAVAVLAIYASSQKPGFLDVLKTIFKNPFIWSCIVGTSINLLEIPIYEPLLNTADILGRAALGAGLLLVGGGLMIRNAFRPPLVVMIPTILKLLIMPLLVAAFCYLFDVTGEALAVALVCGSVPTAMNGFILARQMGGDATLYATITVIQTLLSFLTIPLILSFVQ
ncbi:MAG: AEC family transporter, partial [Fimbriimonadaceae bacterium]|nr:AEC family transporter [Alphaproteobacteria bacterium]